MVTEDQQTYRIIGAAIEVHKALGCGFAEPVYQEALACDLGDRKIPYRKEVPFDVVYKGRVLKTTYRADFVCFGSTIVGLKALTHLSGGEEAQVLNCLRASNLNKALLIDCGERSLRHRRFVN